MARKRTAIDEVIQALEEEENDMILADQDELDKLNKQFNVSDDLDIDDIVTGCVGVEEF